MQGSFFQDGGNPLDREIEPLVEKWRRYQSGLSWAEPARYAIVESWERSKAAGLQRGDAPRFRRVTDLQARLWNRYLELYRSTTQSGDAGLPAAFLAAVILLIQSSAGA